MINQENPGENNINVVDRRNFHTDGTVKQDLPDEPQEQPLTTEQRLDRLERELSGVIGGCEEGFANVSEQFRAFGQQLGLTITDLHARLGAFEEIGTNPKLSEYREKFINGTLVLDDIKKIVEEVVLPEMRKQTEEMIKQRQAAMFGRKTRPTNQ